MKIISWNLKNIGINKLANGFTAAFQAYGLGNNVLDYMMNVVMGNNAWNNINTLVPADIFVIIELKCGGHAKGYLPPGPASPTLQAITAAMNMVVANTPAFIGNYNYNFVNPLIVGRHEAVGVIFNTHALNFVTTGVLRDNNLRLINPRTPNYVGFTTVVGGNNLNVIGIHAPPPKGGTNVKYRPPIQFANKVATVPELALPDTLIMGDYNCSTNSVYNSGAGNIGWNFAGYNTSIPNGTLTSVRQKVANTQPPPANYLSGPYDNLLRNINPPGTIQVVLDTIGNARNITINPNGPTNLNVVLRNYNKVSDHLPLSMY